MKRIIFLLGICCFAFNAYADVENPGSPGHVCTETACWEYPGGGDVERTLCSGKNAGDDCSSLPTGAEKAKCINNSHNGSDVMSCAAKECSSGWLLWLTKRGGKWESQGLCRSYEWLQKKCDTGCSKCQPNEKCVVNVKPNSDRNIAAGYGGDAFWDSEACHCVPNEEVVDDSCEALYADNIDRLACCIAERDGEPVQWNEETGRCECTDGRDFGYLERKCKGDVKIEPVEPCVYKFDAYHKCQGTNREIRMHKEYPVSAEMMADVGVSSGKCEDFKQKIQEMIDGDKTRFENLVNKWCPKIGDIVKPDDNNNDAEIQAAKQSLDAFMTTALNNRNVWKNKDGQFNTSRLASDLTAGVVLGTVGGIVSANVIKKKQIEKGFDALHCIVGGQKVADWGDQFNVGFRRY